MTKLQQELMSRIKAIVKTYAEAGCSQVMQKWASINDDSIHGNSEIIASSAKTANAVVTQSFLASGQKAWIAEFGKGSLMDSEGENPFLADYKGDKDIWNDLRPSDNSVVGRPKGEYHDLDNKVYHSSGRLAGVNLEQWINARTGNSAVMPVRGKHIIRETLRQLLPDMQEEIQEAIAEYVMALIREKFPKVITIC